MMTDPIADMLTRIRNAGRARHAHTLCPSSKQKLAVATVLQRAGFLDSVVVEERDGHQSLVLGIRYDEAGRPLIDGIQRVSKPGRRVYVGREDLPRVRDFKGVSPKAFDGRGNYSLGIREQIIFPEIDYDSVENITGLNVTVVTSARNDTEGKALLQHLGMPFRP